MYFVLDYDELTRTLVSFTPLSDPAEATRLRLGLYRANMGTSRRGIILVADSVEDLKVTHGRYFTNGVPESMTPEEALRDLESAKRKTAQAARATACA